jgi:hypothetical protein
VITSTHVEHGLVKIGHYPSDYEEYFAEKKEKPGQYRSIGWGPHGVQHSQRSELTLTAPTTGFKLWIKMMDPHGTGERKNIPVLVRITGWRQKKLSRTVIRYKKKWPTVQCN